MTCVWSSNGPIVIKWEQGSAGISIHVREGTRASLVGTAAGQIFLAYLDGHEIKAVLQHDIKDWNEHAPAAKKMTIKDVEALKASIRKRGLVHSFGYHNPALSVLSAPVFGENRLSMSLSLVGIRDTFYVGYTGRAAQDLKMTADSLSRLLGGQLTEEYSVNDCLSQEAESWALRQDARARPLPDQPRGGIAIEDLGLGQAPPLGVLLATGPAAPGAPKAR